MKCNIPLLGLNLDMAKAKDLDILEALISGARGKFEREPTKEKKPLRTQKDILVLGDDKPPKGVGGKVVTLFEKLEAKHGVGKVTREMLRKGVEASKSIPDYAAHSTIGALIGKGVLKYYDHS